MSLWEFNKVVSGKISASGGDQGEAKAPSDAEYYAALEEAFK